MQPLCDNGGQVWVTERPSTEPTFPGANLWCGLQARQTDQPGSSAMCNLLQRCWIGPVNAAVCPAAPASPRLASHPRLPPKLPHCPAPLFLPSPPAVRCRYFCEGGLNMLGVGIDACVNNGTTCTQVVPDALCQAFGFDRAWTEDLKLAPANPREAVRSLTGEVRGWFGGWASGGCGQQARQQCKGSRARPGRPQQRR